MASDEGDDLEDLLGRVSKKLGWQKPSESAKRRKKKKAIRSSSKKTPRRSRKDVSSSSDKENSVVNGCNQQNDNSASEGCFKSQENSTSKLLSDLATKTDKSEHGERWAPSRDTLKCLTNTTDGEDNIQLSPPVNRDKSDLDTNSSLLESVTGTQNLEKDSGVEKEEEAFLNIPSNSVSSDCESDHVTCSNSIISNADIKWVPNAEVQENQMFLSLSDGQEENDDDDDDIGADEDFAAKTENWSKKLPSSIEEPDIPFSPLHKYSETFEPIKWLLSPPPKNVPVKAKSEKIATVTLSDSDSDSPVDADVETLSLSERLAKNFKKQKSITKPVIKNNRLANGAYAKNSDSSDDSDSWKDDFQWSKDQKSTSTKQRTPAKNLQKYESSDDDDFETFLHAIKSSHPAPESSQHQSPIVDEDQYENSFIDDAPLNAKGDSDDEVFYYKQINSDKKKPVNITKQKEQQNVRVKKTPTFLNYRLPRFSDSSDDEKDVFATPKPPAKLHKPKITSSSKKFTPVSSVRTPTQGSTQSEFLVSLTTPKVGFVSPSPYVRDFKKQRETLTKKLFTIYNQTVFDNKLPSDFSIKWNNRMRKTAGYCYYTKTRLGGQCSARIELSEKVCDTAERLRDTLIHELCHAACWLINGVNDGHGRFWKYWAAKANHAHPTIPVIKRCHSYEITTKYKYQCVTCKTTIGRHSKSINTAKFCCAYCKGSIVLLPPLNKDGKIAKVRTPNKFAMFVKENYGSAKKGNSSMKHADIMRLLSQDFSRKAAISV